MFVPQITLLQVLLVLGKQCLDLQDAVCSLYSRQSRISKSHICCGIIGNKGAILGQTFDKVIFDVYECFLEFSAAPLFLKESEEGHSL